MGVLVEDDDDDDEEVDKLPLAGSDNETPTRLLIMLVKKAATDDVGLLVASCAGN